MKGYPTLIFFTNGQKINYSGQRNQLAIINWLERKVKDLVEKINEKKYKNLNTSGTVSIIYHGDYKSNSYASQILDKIALYDEYNCNLLTNTRLLLGKRFR